MTAWRTKGLDRETERALLARAKAGDKAAADQVILAHRPLVFGMLTKLKIAKSHPRYSDFFQEGVVGLLMALKRWDLAQEVRFSTYAQWWVRHLIASARVNTANAVVPGRTRGIRRARTHLSRHAERLRHRLGREATAEELAHSIGPPTTAADAAYVRQERALVLVPLDDQSGVPEGLYEHRTPEGIYGEDDARARMMRLVGRAMARVELSARERIIFQRRVLERVSLRRVGAEVGLCGERIRQIECSMLKRLRAALAEHEVEALEILRVA